MPNDTGLSVEEKREMFSVKNGMTKIFGNFPRRGFNKLCKAGCEKEETIHHIYDCERLGNTKNNPYYQEIYNGNLTQQVNIFKIIQKKLEQRKILEYKK